MIQTSFKILQQKVQLSTAIIKFHLTMEIDMKYTKSKLIAITKTLQIWYSSQGTQKKEITIIIFIKGLWLSKTAQFQVEQVLMKSLELIL